MPNALTNSYRFPAEWEPHSAVWLAWSYDKITFGTLNQKDNKMDEGRLARVEKEFMKIIDALKESEQVNLIVRDKAEHSDILKNVRMFETDYADVWTRDYIPTFAKSANGKLVAVKWNYNAYGEKFAGLIKDNHVWGKINTELNINTVEPKIVLESGAIETNGNGVLLTTLQCLIKRNPHLSKEDYEKVFAKFLGITKVIWLKGGLVNDHTDGHIDDIAKFVAPNKILCAYEDNTEDENYEILKNNFETLERENFELIKLPMPHMNYDDGKKAPASYANFYIGNSVVLVPTYNDPNDEKALKIIQSCFPNRKVIGINCKDLIYGGGAIHCMTQQQPAI